MKFLQKAAAAVAAAVVSISAVMSAQAAVNPDAQTIVTDDAAETEYIPIDKSAYVRWENDVAPQENTNYYIDSTVSIQSLTLVEFPASSSLVICEGGNLKIFSGARLYIYGSVIVEPKAAVTVTGTFTFFEGSSFVNYGTFVSTKSSTLRLSSAFVNKSGATAVVGGAMYVYDKGSVTNFGELTLSANSNARVTGSFSNEPDARTFLKGTLSITVSGSATLDGRFSLIGVLINSGTLTLEEDVKVYIGEDSRLSTSRSSRIIDNRNVSSDDLTSGSGNSSSAVESDTIRGIDVSSWQGIIDWETVKASGVQFAMIRASIGDDKVDNTFEYNIVEAAKAGIEVGVYHYCYATTVEEAIAEAQHFIEVISPYKITYPVVMDFEDNSQAGLPNKLKNEIAEAFIGEIRAAGYYPMIYSYVNWYEKYMDMDELDCEVWIAHWGVAEPSYSSGSYGMWQYSSVGTVSGIYGDVDLDISLKDYAAIIKAGGYNNLSDFD